MRAVLAECKYDQAKAADMLSVDRDELWNYINSPAYMRFMREDAHANMLRIHEQAAVETPRNILALCDIRDNSDKDRERIAAVKALEIIFSEYKLPAAPMDDMLPQLEEERQRQAIERLRAALQSAEQSTHEVN